MSTFTTRIPETLKAKGLNLYAQRYGVLGPTLAAETLTERRDGGECGDRAGLVT